MSPEFDSLLLGCVQEKVSDFEEGVVQGAVQAQASDGEGGKDLSILPEAIHGPQERFQVLFGPPQGTCLSAKEEGDR